MLWKSKGFARVCTMKVAVRNLTSYLDGNGAYHDVPKTKRCFANMVKDVTCMSIKRNMLAEKQRRLSCRETTSQRTGSPMP